MSGGRVRAEILGVVVSACLAAVCQTSAAGTKHWPPGHGGEAPPVSPVGGQCSVSPLLVPSCGAWWGVVPGALTDVPTTEALARFEDKIDRTVDIVHFYHRGAELFPTAEEIAIAREKGKHRLLFLDWKPEAGHTWAEVAHGAVDGEIDRLAAYVTKHFCERFFLAIHHEPEEEVDPHKGSGYTAKDYAAMFRHVVTRLRADGVANAVTVMTYMGAEKWGTRPWFDALYPGDDVVDWIAFDPFAGEGVHSFDDLVNKWFGGENWPGFYAWATKRYPDKPLMLAEWGVFSQPDDREHKAEVFRAVGRGGPDYPRIKAYVYFASPHAPRGDTTIDSTRSALEAYRAISDLAYFTPPGP
ncbi:MAG: hypothetical protein ACRDN9_11410 [Streptosporangiaceae bacterium]